MKNNRCKLVLNLVAVIFLSTIFLNCYKTCGEEIDAEYNITISLGMNKEDIFAKLGFPKVKRRFADGSEVWVYVLAGNGKKSDTTYSVIFDRHGKVIQAILPRKEEQNQNKDINVLVK
jgi:outer membrane protein assembly factor BamE (lipoprotein component of BamABCDE complex)